MGWQRAKRDLVIEYHFTFVEFFSEEIRQNTLAFLYIIILMLDKNWKKEIIWYVRE